MLISHDGHRPAGGPSQVVVRGGTVLRFYPALHWPYLWQQQQSHRREHEPRILVITQINLMQLGSAVLYRFTLDRVPSGPLFRITGTR